MFSRGTMRVIGCSVLLLLAVHHLRSQNAAQRTVHVFVSLADNQNQGIVPVPARLGNGFDPAHNLYWGAEAGVKTFFQRSTDWMLLTCAAKPNPYVLERCIFKHRSADVFLVADAYRGNEIRQAILDFFDAAAGGTPETTRVEVDQHLISIRVRGGSSLVAYVGHDGLMDFQLPAVPRKRDDVHRDVIILACASKQYFTEPLKTSGAYPLLWTTNLMAPEAYTLKAALDGSRVRTVSRFGSARLLRMTNTKSAVCAELADCSPPAGDGRLLLSLPTSGGERSIAVHSTSLS